MKFKMTIDDALAYADEWNRGRTIHEDSQGWRTVCLILAEEVRRLQKEIEQMHNSSDSLNTFLVSHVDETNQLLDAIDTTSKILRLRQCED